MLANLGDLRGGIDALAEATGTVDEAYEQFLQSASGQWTMLTTRMRMAGDTLAQHVLPAVNDMVGKMADLASWVGGAIEQWPGLGRAVVWFGVGLVGVTAAVATWNAMAWVGGGVMSIWGARTKAAEAAGKLWTATTKTATAAALRWNAAVAWSAARLPFLRAGLVGAGGEFRVFGASVGVGTAALRVFRMALITTGVGAIVVALGAGAAWIMRNWEPLKAFFAGVARGIGDALGPLSTRSGPSATCSGPSPTRCAALLQHARAGATLDLEVPGQPNTWAGGLVVVRGHDPLADGRWTVTRATHSITPTGYRTTISAAPEV